MRKLNHADRLGALRDRAVHRRAREEARLILGGGSPAMLDCATRRVERVDALIETGGYDLTCSGCHQGECRCA